jgi:hypothetical protein
MVYVSRALLADVSNGWIPSGFGQLMHLKWVEMCVGGVSGSSGDEPALGSESGSAGNRRK